MYCLINRARTLVVGPFKTLQEAEDYRAEASLRKNNVVNLSWQTIEMLMLDKF